MRRARYLPNRAVGIAGGRYGKTSHSRPCDVIARYLSLLPLGSRVSTRENNLPLPYATETMSLDLVLDWRIRFWVLLPISVACILMGLLRSSFVSLLIRPHRVDLFKVRDAAALSRSSAFRRASRILHPAQVAARRSAFTASEGPLKIASTDKGSPLAALMNPEQIGNQVVGILSSTVPTVILGAWVRSMFGGFAVCRLPFPLSQRFRGMLQSGIERAGQSLDVRYASAFSWFIFNLFGSSTITQLLLPAGVDPVDTFPSDNPTSTAGQLAAVFRGFNDARESERKALDTLNPVYSLPEVESRLVSQDPTAL